MKVRRLRWAALVAAIGLLLGACSSSRQKDTTTAGGATTTEKASSGAGSGMFGDLKSPCGKGDAKGATDQGVTDTSIKIGYGDDAGFSNSPGLNHQMSDAVKAFVKWCNDQGGINGRQVDATYYDAKITEVNNVMTEACTKEFFLVGEGFSLDSGQEQIRRGCGLPAVAGYAVSPQFANAPLKFEPMPVPADRTVTSGVAQLAKLFPKAPEKAAVIYANYAATIDTKDKAKSAWPQLGYKFICEQQYNILGEADWRPIAQKVKDCGAEFVYFVGSPYPNFENLLAAADQLGFKPIWYTDPNFYDLNFAKWNTAGLGDKVYMRQAYIPLEEAKYEPATQQYLDIVKATGGDVNQLGEQSASAFLLWATAAKDCGSNLTRQCMLDKLKNIHDWTGGGMHAKADPGNNDTTQCGVLLKLTGTKFERVVPKKPGTYECNPSYAAKVTGPELERAKLDANRISQL